MRTKVKMSNRSKVVILSVIIILGGYIAIPYFVAYNTANKILEELPFSRSDTSVEITSYFPVRADLLQHYTIINPTNTGFSLRIDGAFYYYEKYVDSVNEIIWLYPNAPNLFTITISLDPSADSETEESGWSFKGTATLSANVFGVLPVSVTKELDWL